MVIAFSKMKGKVEPLDFHSHEYYEVYVYHGGDCYYIVDNQIINLTPGMILLMNGRSIHKAHVFKNQDNYERSVLHFKPELIDKLIQEMNCKYLLNPFFEKDVSVGRVNDVHELEKIAYIIDDLNQLSLMEMNDKINKEIKLGIVKLLMFIDRVCKPVKPENNASSDIKKYYVEETVLFLKNNFSKPITIEKIGKELCLSPSYLSRIFKETTGYTIMNYLMYYRFTQAKYLIEISDDLTFKAIAENCGFQSPSHFSRFIKEHTGMSPTEFKKNIQTKSYISPLSRQSDT